MKVKVELTVDINVENYKIDFGLETAQQVREDVRDYIVSQVDDLLHGLNYGSVV